MTHAPDCGSHIIVMGDLCVDVLIDCNYSDSFVQLDTIDGESALRASNSLSVGGSAWLLAHAAKAAGFFCPIILAAVGDDIWGSELAKAIQEEGLLDGAIQSIESASTDSVCMITMRGGHRLMFMPRKSTNNRLGTDFVRDFLRTTDPFLISWTWISGYALTDRKSSRWQAATLLADWSRKKGVPVVLDLVPHEFSTSVGTLDEVVSFLGRPDVLLGAPSTFRDFGYAYDEDDNDLVRKLKELAVQASQDWGIVVTQTHISPDRFGQVVARHGTVIYVDELVMPAHDVRGTGDRLAIEALHRLS